MLTFEEFLKIPGCATGSHSSEKSEVKAPVVTAPSAQGKADAAVQGDVGAAAPDSIAASTSNLTISGPPAFKVRPNAATSSSNDAASETAAAEVEQDPPNATIPPNSKCKRAGCTCAFTSELSRSDEECLFHPLPAIFHEGSKGYVSRPGVF